MGTHRPCLDEYMQQIKASESSSQVACVVLNPTASCTIVISLPDFLRALSQSESLQCEPPSAICQYTFRNGHLMALTGKVTSRQSQAPVGLLGFLALSLPLVLLSTSASIYSTTSRRCARRPTLELATSTKSNRAYIYTDSASGSANPER